MKKITISTTHKGFNYGTSLQAYASKLYLTKLGYNAELIWYKESFFKGRDIRFKKVIFMFLRTFWRPKLFVKTYLTYKKSLKKEITEETKAKFLKFVIEKLQVKRFSWKKLKAYVRKNNVLACVCGSDQIWNATNVYIDPIYYLRFAPRGKRVAYAPSLGKNEIPPSIKKSLRKIFQNLTTYQLEKNRVQI